ncbi:MAG: DnaJ domain-containing protein, partial [Myxococcota bacterium]
MMQDPYSVLGVTRGASEDEIRSAYRKLARELHPDVNPNDTKAEERFKEVSAAYDVLSDQKKRELFDEFGADGLKSGFDPNQARQYQQWSQGFGGGTSGFGGGGGGFRMDFDPAGGGGFEFGDVFGDLFGGGNSGFRQRPRRGQDVLVKVQIDLDQAIHGADIQVAVSGRSAPVKVRIPKGAD